MDGIDQEIAAGDEDIAAGRPADALQRVAALLERHPADPRPYRAAAHALFACAGQAGVLARLDSDWANPLFRRLLLQAECATRPFILHEQVANRLTSRSAAEVAPIVAALEPVLQASAGPKPPTPILLFLLVARAHLGRWMGQARLSTLHRAGFPAFGERDLALPYSAMFHPEAFGRNRDDLLQALRADGPAFLAPLKPHHLPLMAWSAGGALPWPTPQALAAWLERVAAGPLDQSDGQAARALVLAGGAPIEKLPPVARASLGLNEAVADAAGTLASTRRTLRGVATGGGARAAARLARRPWQGVEAARSILAGRLPFLRRADRRIRVAVCVSGQLRGFARALPTWRRSLFAQVDAQFFVHSWAAIGRGPAQPWRVVLPFAGARFTEAYRRLAMQEGMDAFEARYPALYRELNTSGAADAGTLRDAYRTEHVVLDDEADPRFAGWTNQRKMHWKIEQAHGLASASGQAFDLFVRIRPDLSLRTQAFSWSDMRAACRGAPRLYADGALGVHHGVPMIGDQFAIGAEPAMSCYAATVERYPPLAALDLAGAPRELTGHVSLAQSCWMHGIAVHRAPVRFGRLLDPEPFPNAAVLRAIEADAAPRMDAIDRELIAAARADAH